MEKQAKDKTAEFNTSEEKISCNCIWLLTNAFTKIVVKHMKTPKTNAFSRDGRLFSKKMPERNSNISRTRTISYILSNGVGRTVLLKN